MKRKSARHGLGMVLLGLAAVPLTGCPPQSSDCASFLQFGTYTWCDTGGPATYLNGSHNYSVTGGVEGPAGADASLWFRGDDSVGSHAVHGPQVTVSEHDPDGTAEGIGVGTYVSTNPEITIAVADPDGPFQVQSGTVTITRVQASSALPSQLAQLTATFDLVTDRGQITGSVRIH